MLQAGTYWGTNPQGAMEEVGEKKTPAMVVTFEVGHIAVNGEWQPLTTTETRDLYLWTTEAAWPTTAKKLETLGFNGDFARPEFDLSGNSGGISLTCAHETYNGAQKEKWELSEWGGRERHPASQDLVRRMNARWKQANGGYRESPKAPSAPPARPQPAPPAEPEYVDGPPPDDEIPY